MHKKQDFMSFLAVVSILGFLVIVLQGLAGIDISSYVQGLIFIIIGVGLAIIGNIRSIINYFDKGINYDEMAHIMTAVVGVFSVLVGLR